MREPESWKGYTINADFREIVTPRQKTSRRIPLQLQEPVEKKPEKLTRDGHIEKISDKKDEVFIQPTVITVKRDKSVKIALDARLMNRNIEKDNNQMPNWDDIMCTLAEKITGKQKKQIWFTSVDLKFKYG